MGIKNAIQTIQDQTNILENNESGTKKAIINAASVTPKIVEAYEKKMMKQEKISKNDSLEDFRISDVESIVYREKDDQER